MASVIADIKKPAEGKKLSPAKAGFVLSWVRWKYFPVLCLAVWCLAGVLLRSGPSSTVVTSPSAYADFMLPVSGAWALESGMHIHTDFSTPLGLAYYLPYYWMLKLFGNTDAVVRHTESAVFVFFSILSFLLLRPPRFSWMITALGVSLISLLAASPILLGDPPTEIYEGIAYNFICIAMGYLCLLVTVFPPQGTPNVNKRREIIDALLLSAGLAWITFVKINYLAQNGLFLGVGCLLGWLTLGRRTPWFYVTLAGGFLLMATVFVIMFGIDLKAMFDDIHTAANCRSHWVFSMLPQSDSTGGGAYLGITALYMRAQKVLMLHQAELVLLAGTFLGGVGAVVILGRTLLWRLAGFGGLMVLVLFFDVSQDFFNTYGDALPMIPFLWLFIVCVLERGKCIDENAATASAAHSTLGWVSKLSMVAVACYIALLSAGHLAAFIFNTGISDRLGTDITGVLINREDSLQADGWKHLYYPVPRSADKSALSFNTKINQGLALLRENKVDQKRVFVMDQINPFPFLLHTPYPMGQPCWMHVEGTFNLQNHLPPETLFRGTDVILVPKSPLNSWCLQVMGALYKPYIDANFFFLAQNDSWQLLQRKSTGM